MYKLLLTAALMGCVFHGALARGKPDCTGKASGDRVEDPSDVQKYFVCMAKEIPTHASLSCGETELFDPDLGLCVPGSRASRYVPPPCHLTCADNTDVTYDAENCTVYMECIYVAGGVVIGRMHSCPTDRPYFDGKHCVTNKEKCCSELCRPYCYPNVLHTPDPINCHAYYICLEEGPADESHHYVCEAGKVFVASLGQCVEGAECKPPCRP